MTALALLSLLTMAALPLDADNSEQEWSAGTAGADVRISALVNTLEQIPSGSGPWADVVASGGSFIPAQDCQYILLESGGREEVCWPSTGLGSYDPGMYGAYIADSLGEPLFAGLESEPEPIILTWADVATLPIQGGTIEMPNPEARDLNHAPAIAWSTATTHTLTTTILNTPVEVRLTPTQWDW